MNAMTNFCASAKDKKLVSDDTTYYGIIRQILELDYFDFTITIFCCDWVRVEDKARDPTRSQSHGDSSRGMELCELINMHREVVAKGRATRANIILDATLDTPMDIYNVRVCLVIDLYLAYLDQKNIEGATPSYGESNGEGFYSFLVRCGILFKSADFRISVTRYGITIPQRISGHSNGTSAGLSLLETICSHKQPENLDVSIGVVPLLIELLPSLNPNCLESALYILDVLATLSEGKSALKDCPKTIPILVKLLMQVSDTCCVGALEECKILSN
ncbi:hypothetical protein IFM89_007440 [Coptis chinensis]|uniref:U-box domain-containing protein n=1 Tax=Coptis chinensis TaxID=261450 RepID=A0A835IBL6_9MAGN|nr:hypothetical protein IFM89_007440 [Coptis chinensis]